MPTLQTLREARAIIRWMLAWFVLSIGVAVAAPVVQPQAMSLVCSANGSVLVLTADDGTVAPAQSSSHTLDCVLCLPAGAPPFAEFTTPNVAAQAQTKPAARPAPVYWRTSEPTSARDPPLCV